MHALLFIRVVVVGVFSPRKKLLSVQTSSLASRDSSVPADIGDLQLLSQGLLDACAEALDTIPAWDAALLGAPDRQFVSAGLPVWDCCLVGDSMVSTERGPVRIADVRPDDLVWAYDEGNLVLRRVVRSVAKGIQPVLRARGRRRAIVGTADHPMLCLRPERAHPSTGRRQEWGTEWVPIGELVRGDILVALDHLGEQGTPAQLPDGKDLSPDLAWLLGLWVGDGCFDSEDGICLFIHNGVRDRAEEILRQTWGVRPRGNSERLEVKSRELYDVFAQVLQRVRAPEKRVPEIMWNREPEVTRSFLDGYAAADGSTDDHDYRHYATASPALAAETRMLHVGLGDAVSNLAVQERTQPISIRGRVVQEARPLHRFSVYPDSPRGGSVILDYRGARRALPDERLGVCTVSDVSDWGEAETFDLEVEGAHNFIADGLVVHNCEQLVVHVVGLVEGNTSPGGLASGKRYSTGRINHVILNATMTRCISTGVESSGGAYSPPTVANLGADGVQHNADGWALWNHLYNLQSSGLFLNLCDEVFFEGITSAIPAGGCAGWVVAVRAYLGGYNETLTT
jgi:hypothetical protein